MRFLHEPHRRSPRRPATGEPSSRYSCMTGAWLPSVGRSSRPLQLAGWVGGGECVCATGLVEERVAGGVTAVGAGSGGGADDDLGGMLGVVKDAVEAAVGERLEIPSAGLAGGVDDQPDPRSGA